MSRRYFYKGSTNFTINNNNFIILDNMFLLVAFFLKSYKVAKKQFFLKPLLKEVGKIGDSRMTFVTLQLSSQSGL